MKEARHHEVCHELTLGPQRMKMAAYRRIVVETLSP
jgi:hypothetical protein